eukprot:scaffold109281_cov22-Cyclotella_meneghiniana.AAC.1
MGAAAESSAARREFNFMRQLIWKCEYQGKRKSTREWGRQSRAHRDREWGRQSRAPFSFCEEVLDCAVNLISIISPSILRTTAPLYQSCDICWGITNILCVATITNLTAEHLVYNVKGLVPTLLNHIVSGSVRNSGGGGDDADNHECAKCA